MQEKEQLRPKRLFEKRFEHKQNTQRSAYYSTIEQSNKLITKREAGGQRISLRQNLKQTEAVSQNFMRAVQRYSSKDSVQLRSLNIDVKNSFDS